MVEPEPEVMEVLVRRCLKWGRDYRWTCGSLWWDDLDSAALWGLARALSVYQPDNPQGKTLLAFAFRGVHMSVRSFLRSHQGWYQSRKDLEREKRLAEQKGWVAVALGKRLGYSYLEDLSVDGSSWHEWFADDTPIEDKLSVREFLPQGVRLGERDVLLLELACDGYTDREIGERLGISTQRVNEVKRRVRREMRKARMGGEDNGVPVPMTTTRVVARKKTSIRERLKKELGR